MPSAPYPVASSSSSKRSRPERRPSRAALERNLQILDRLEPLLPPDFPTPSTSRSAAPGSKRSADHLAGNQDTKRQRVGADSARRYEHSVDGVDDARQQPQHPVHQAIQAPMPIVRPRRRLERSNDIWAKKASEYRELARKLKFSGEAHNSASFAPNSSSYKPLKNPPPPGDPYHQHMSLMARLELIDSLICFAYSHWLSDYSARSCNPIAWRSSGPLTSVVSQLWTTDAVDEREKCFNGLVLLIDGFVNSRIVAYEQARSKSDFAKLDAERNRVYAREKATKEKRVRAERAAAQGPANSLPSPASTSTPGSADSNSPKEKELSAQDFELSRGEWTKQFISIPGPVADEALSLASAAGSARRALTYAPSSLNLRTLMIHFPKTFARVLYSTLQHDDEAEPDMEDKDGELYWPSTPSSGEGIGWVCLLGKAMINEFGGTIGYRGYDGCVPKVAEPKQQEQ